MTDVLQYSNPSLEGVFFSDTAIKRLLSYLAQQGQSHRIVRLSVKKTGCSGMAYVIDYVETAQEKDMVFPFVDDYLVCVDKASYPYLKGIHIDYVKQGLNQKFVFNNPNQTGQCGCGESFTVD